MHFIVWTNTFSDLEKYQVAFLLLHGFHPCLRIVPNSLPLCQKQVWHHFDEDDANADVNDDSDQNVL